MAAWHFLTIPPEISSVVSLKYSKFKRGWGSIPVEVRIGKVRWNTSIFPDKKSKTYLLPLKKEIRRTCEIVDGDIVEFKIKIFS